MKRLSTIWHPLSIILKKIKMKISIDMEKPFREEKRMRLENKGVRNPFDALSDDLIISVLTKTAASADSPSDLLGIMSSCKRMRKLGMDPIVLRNASCKAISVRDKSWCNEASQYLSNCSNAGNVDASFTLGMIEFCCFGHYASGADLLVKAAQESHGRVRISLRVIQIAVSNVSTSPRQFCYDVEHPVAVWAKSVTPGQNDDTTSIGYSIWSLTEMIMTVNSMLCYPRSESIDSRLNMQQRRQAHSLNVFLTEWWQLPDVKSEIELNCQEISRGLCDIREMTNDSVEVLTEKCYTALMHAVKCIGKLKTTRDFNMIDR